MLAAAGLILQVAAYAATPGVATPTDPTTDSLRSAETRFLLTWRREWMMTPRPQQTYLRIASLHCHFDGSWQYGMPNIIRSEKSKRSFCPIWYPADDSLRADEANGVDVSLTDESRALMRRARASLIDRFRSAADSYPANPWIAGQLVRLNLDQRDTSAALHAANACRESKAWCLMLEGYVRFETGRTAVADSLFMRGVAAMGDQDRCEWMSVAPLLDARSRVTYDRMPCASRDSVNATYWWLADPLYIEPGNARRAEHLARQVAIRLHSAVVIDERWDWRPRFGGDALATMIIRYGWPSYNYWAGLMEDGGHFEWLGFRDNAVNVAPEYALPRFHTTPPWRAVLDPSTLRASDWDHFSPRQGYGDIVWENDEWPLEHAGREGGPIVEVPDQTVTFRRDNDALFAIGLDMPQRFFRPGVRVPYDVAVFAGRTPNDRWRSERSSMLIDGSRTAVLTSPIAAHDQIVSAELAPADGAFGLAARARRAVRPPMPLSLMQPKEIAISDPLFFRPGDDDAVPRSASEAIDRMLGSLTFSGKRVGVFWEMYGVKLADTVAITLRITRQEPPGFFRRLGSSIGLSGIPEPDAIAISWTEPRPNERASITYLGGVPIQARSLVVDISRLKPGRYGMEILVAKLGAPPVSTRRDVMIRR